ncbi:hypothetical protein FACHB389_06745 [Nostoc calcicola FACHB-389]|nr:hypothetical protein [Nostoc calcicola FACHB-3891]OKH40695.1 hypothetical protein FACHB389_06745 [Nostoc calcicola FACHB-389]
MLNVFEAKKLEIIVSKAHEHIVISGFEKEVLINCVAWDEESNNYVVVFYTDYGNYDFINVWVAESTNGYCAVGHNLDSQPFSKSLE